MERGPIPPDIKQAILLIIMLLMLQLMGGIGLGIASQATGIAFLAENMIVNSLFTLIAFYIVLAHGFTSSDELESASPDILCRNSTEFLELIQKEGW